MTAPFLPSDEAYRNAHTLEMLIRSLTVREPETFAVTASRTWYDWRTIWGVLAHMPGGALMFNGMADGGDCLCRSFWRAQGSVVRPFPADWKTLGNPAGHVRNTLMMEHMPRLVLAFVCDDGPSRGTRDAIREADNRDIPVFEFYQHADPNTLTSPAVGGR